MACCLLAVFLPAVLLTAVLLTAVPAASAQTAAAAPPSATADAAVRWQWALWVEGRVADWPAPPVQPVDSLAQVVEALEGAWQEEGFLMAQVDSVRIARETATVAVYATQGPAVRVGRLRFMGADQAGADRLLQEMNTRPGQVFRPGVLQDDIEVLLTYYERIGLPLAQITVEALTLDEAAPADDGPPRVDLDLRVDEGAVLRLRRIDVVGAERTAAGYVAQVAGLRVGHPIQAYQPDAIRQRLEATTFFKEVGPPEIAVLPDSGVVLRIPVTEASPGAFDLVLGYLPAARAGGSGSLVGNGHLELRNLFGGGRVMSLKLNRLPGQVSSVDVRLIDPFVLGLPFGVEGQFEGLQQDSTYGKQRYAGVFNYRFERGVELFTTVTRERTNPGPAGLRLGAQGRQRIPQSSAFFAGLGVRIQRLDRVINPRRGFFFESNLERGRKERTALVRTAGQDTTTEASTLRQERLRSQGRFFVPTFRRQVVALGGEASLLLSNAFDESDLFRLGGATTLRGYDEDAFRGSFTSRLFAEYRYQLDRTSYAYLFFDAGIVKTPGDLGLGADGFYPGFGVGIQFQTTVGLINASYAISPDDGPANGRIHVGLSFGL